ncbi:4a-hydroxytetrahydrobiopterin dehydratase [Bacillus solitudinis]|uniref:4a-hydroxytetrahydrobiopterin dehydratase n=1 Tax=Bacillus solitudinis TaxID=2014074 RepID=UPI000C239C91|nr:4a-hydroxytetrahydrobiopterin dehydratase [Bacillus solitudinis]
MERLNIEVVQKHLSQLSGWAVSDEKWLVKKYRFRSYLSGIEFVNKIANLSEEENHHPFISIDYILVTIKLSSWKANGITNLDLRLIEEYDQFYAERKEG